MPASHSKNSEATIVATDVVANGVTVTNAVTNSALGNIVSGCGQVDNLIAYFVVASYSGLTNIVVKLQDSPDQTTWTDIPNATSGTLTANGTVRVALSAPFGPYIRAVATSTGTGTALASATVVTKVSVTAE